MVSQPRLDRAITLHMQGDWGVANLHRICGWLSAGLGERTAAGSRFAIWNGRGGTDSIKAVAEKEVDLALFVPAGFAATVLNRRGLYEGEGIENLRALATMPQDDRLVLAVDSSYGFTTLDDIRRAKPPLRLATSPDDGVNTVGFAAARLLAAAGLSRSDIESWGGAILEGEAPGHVIPRATRGEADAVLFEAIMTPWWDDLLEARDMTFVAIDGGVLDDLERRYGWRRGTVRAGHFRGQHDAFETLDFSDFLMIARDDMPDDLAYLLAWHMCENRDGIERQYRHLPPDRSPLTYPLDPAKMARTAIPLHDGAARYYAEAGVRNAG